MITISISKESNAAYVSFGVNIATALEQLDGNIARGVDEKHAKTLFERELMQSILAHVQTAVQCAARSDDDRAVALKELEKAHKEEAAKAPKIECDHVVAAVKKDVAEREAAKAEEKSEK